MEGGRTAALPLVRTLHAANFTKKVRDYLHCVEATTEGCSQYVGDTENPTMLVELYQRAERRRDQAQAAIRAGRRVLAGKQRELATRAATMRDKAFALAKPEVIDDVKARLLVAREQLEGG